MALHKCSKDERENRSLYKGCINDHFTMICHLLILVSLGLTSAATDSRPDPFAFFAIASRLEEPADIWKALDTRSLESLLSQTATTHRKDCNYLVSLYVSNSASQVNSSNLHSLCQLATTCITSSNSKEIITSLTGQGSSSSPLDTVQLQKCSLILARKDGLQCSKVNSKEVVKQSSTATTASVWAIAFLAVTLINLTSIVGIIVVPFLNKSSYLSALNLFEGLAVGSLTGSALFHLIPAAFNLIGDISDSSRHDYLYISLVVFGGIYLFYWSEQFMKIYAAAKALASKKNVSPVDNHSGDNQLEAIENGDNAPADFESRLRSASDSLAKAHHGHHSHETSVRPKGEIATVAWMIVFGDGLHNFIDGLSIGAAFNDSILTGLSICLAVVCEELPHELGDFAVLIASGMSIRQAVGYNFLSACTCYFGLFMGIWLGDLGPTYIFALAGGMFLYIALVDMMSELTSSVQDALATSIPRTIKVLMLQNTGIVVGILTLFLLARYSENIRL